MTAALCLLGGTPCVVSRGVSVPDFVMAEVSRVQGIQRLPVEPIGSTFVTFSGVHANSEIRVYFMDGSEAAGMETSTDTPSLSWSVYASGSANNTVRIVIIHPDYKIKEFTYTSTLGNQSIPVQQEPDKWYSNPV